MLCGDFNFDVSDPQHAMLHDSSRPGLNYRDAWTIRHPDLPHQPTCGLHDHVQWKDGADCRDFIFITEDLGARVRRIEVDGETAASDHQPVLIELADALCPTSVHWRVATASPRSCRGACWLPCARRLLLYRRMDRPCRSAVSACRIPPRAR